MVRDSHCQTRSATSQTAAGRSTWSRSIFKRGDFPDENFILRHRHAGCLSMCNRGPGFQRPQFFFTFAAKPEWDERHVVFGVLRNRESLRTLFAIDQVGSQFGKPSQEVITRLRPARRRWRRRSTRHGQRHRSQRLRWAQDVCGSTSGDAAHVECGRICSYTPQPSAPS